MKKLAFAAIGLALIVAFFFLRAPSSETVTPAGQVASPSAGAPPALTAATPNISPSETGATAPSPALALPEAAREAARECLGEEHSNWASLSRSIEQKAAAGKRSLQWRVLKTEEEGREIRIRLAREVRESGAEALELKLFSVDEDGLPEPLAARPGQKDNPAAWLSDYLRGKPLLQDSRLEEISLPDGRTLSLETDGNEVVEAQFQGPGQGLACSRKGEELRCRCL